MHRNKRGMELPQGVIIVAIIVLVVLVVVLAFFTGGFGSIGERLRGLFAGGVDDQSTVVSFCSSYCDAVKNFDESQREAVKSSSYCSKWFKLDKDNDGKVDKDSEGKAKRFYCHGSNNAGNPDPKLGEIDSVGVGITCQVTCA